MITPLEKNLSERHSKHIYLKHNLLGKIMYRFPNFHECPYNSVETQRKSHVAYFINKILWQKQY